MHDWYERHRDPRSFVLHIVGIPPTILGFLMIPIYVFLLSATLFLFALSLFVGGYLIQFLGHALDGTEPGEVHYLRRKLAHRLGWSYPEIAPAPKSRRVA